MRRGWLVLVAALATACGGGSSTPATTTPVTAPTPSSAAVVLDSGNFTARVASGTALVEFHSPT